MVMCKSHTGICHHPCFFVDKSTPQNIMTLLYIGVVQLLQGEEMFQRYNSKSSINGDAEKLDFYKTPYIRYVISYLERFGISEFEK